MRRMFMFKKDSDVWDWSKVVYQTSTAGRKFARYSAVSGNPDVGTVMSMNDGTDRNILVLDAQYRTNGKAYYTVNTENLNSSGNQLAVCAAFYNGVARNITDTEFASTSYANIDTNSSYYNTQKLIDYNSTNSENVAYCRSITVNGVGCDSPNINVLCRIFTEATMLDSLDQSLIDTPSLVGQYDVTSWWFGGYGDCWSSSWYGYAYSGYCGTRLNYQGLVYGNPQNGPDGTCPILEL